MKDMKTNRIIVEFLFLVPCLLVIGCVSVTSEVRQPDGTYRETKYLALKSDLQFRDFKCSEDYMVATEFNGVTYAWPKGKGTLSEDFSEVRFKGESISCTVKDRFLTIDGQEFGAFEEGDRIRIAGDGAVFVNDHMPD
ncbi:MAG: hypothetical protein ACYSWO_06805 [Planctomycetota bacterium]